jgi:hypothetical protein
MRLNIVPVVLAVFVAASSFAAGPRDEELWDAAGRGDVATVRRLIAEGVDVNARTRYGATALFFAADKAQLGVATLLLEKGADPNVKDTFYGATPLNWAMNHDATEVVLLLVQKGANDPASALAMSAQSGLRRMWVNGMGPIKLPRAAGGQSGRLDFRAGKAAAVAPRRTFSASCRKVKSHSRRTEHCPTSSPRQPRRPRRTTRLARL